MDEAAGIPLVYVVSQREQRYGMAELAYSLRSVEKYLSGVSGVWIIGDTPSWLNLRAPGLHVVHVPDLFPNPVANTAVKTLVACGQPEITGQFLLMNDDFYCTKRLAAPEIPNVHLGSMWQAFRKHTGWYRGALKNTETIIANVTGYKPLCFEVHYPMRIDPKKFVEARRRVEFVVPDRGGTVLWRSVYGTLYCRNDSVQVRRDCKVYAGDDPEKVAEAWACELGFVSSTPDVGEVMKRTIADAFPEPSQYELPGAMPGWPEVA